MALCASPGSFTDYMEEAILRHILGMTYFTPPTKLMVGLGSSSGSFESGTFNEISGHGYERQKIIFIDDLITDVDGYTSTQNEYKLVFGPAKADWDVVNHMAIFDHATDEMITWAPLATNWYVKRDQHFVIERKDVTVALGKSVPPGYWSQYLQEQILRMVYLSTPYAQPEIYAALSEAMPAISDTGSDLVEPDDPDYRRSQPESWDAPFPFSGAFKSTSPGGRIFATANVDWFDRSPASHVILVDAETGGNLLMLGHTSIDQIIYQCDTATLGECNVGLA